MSKILKANLVVAKLSGNYVNKDTATVKIIEIVECGVVCNVMCDCVYNMNYGGIDQFVNPDDMVTEMFIELHRIRTANEISSNGFYKLNMDIAVLLDCTSPHTFSEIENSVIQNSIAFINKIATDHEVLTRWSNK